MVSELRLKGHCELSSVYEVAIKVCMSYVKELLLISSYVWAYIAYKFICMGIYGKTIFIWVTQTFGNIMRLKHKQSGLWNHLGHLLVRHVLIYLRVVLHVSFLLFV